MTRLLPAILLCLAAPAAAGEVPAAEGLQRARACLAALDYPCAEAELQRARDGAAGLGEADRHLLLRLRAEVALAAGRSGEAEDRLGELLEADPAFRPAGEAWPRGWLEALDRVRSLRPDREAPELEVEPPGETVAGRDLVLRVAATDRSGVGEVVLHLGGPAPRSLPMATSDGRTWSATVPGEAVAAPALLLWIEARDLAGNGPARWGSPGEPRRLPVAPPPAAPRRPLVQRWWFWTLVGVAAAGTGVGIYYLGRAGRGSGGDPGPGRLQVEVQWPSP